MVFYGSAFVNRQHPIGWGTGLAVTYLLESAVKENSPSATALQVAMRRAAHQILDAPKVFDDPLALRMVGILNESSQQLDPKWLEQSALECRLRAFLAARSRCAEDELHDAVNRGVRQYVVLGAGLDTFAFRNPYSADALHIWEVDHPATQTWKHTCLEQAGFTIPATLTFAPVDFDTETIEEGLRRAGFDCGKSTFFSWLGVTPYVTSNAVTDTLRYVASLPAGSGIVFDYMILPSLLNEVQSRAFDLLSHRAALAGEPFKTFFHPSELKDRLRDMGFVRIEDLGPVELNDRYFRGRTDELRVGGISHVMNATT